MNAKVLRLLDANANRAREALRVLEDYTRFVLDDEELSERLKRLRHDLTAASQPFLADAILQRDTPHDVGTSIKLDSELRREELADVVIAAGKRLGEALRAMEEYCKTFDAATATLLEQSRYRFYDIEQAIARALRPGALFDSVRLYVLITQSACRRPWLETAEAAIAGGADALQLREKDLNSGELLQRAKTLAALCKKHNVLLIINDRPDIAVLSGADGVHVGQDDLPAIEVRKIVGREKIVGVSTHVICQARQAVRDGADYIGVGPIFRSSTKPRDWEKIPGLDYAQLVVQTLQSEFKSIATPQTPALRYCEESDFQASDPALRSTSAPASGHLKSLLRIPAVAIAGINLENVDQVLGTGIRAIAVTAAVTGNDDPEAATRSLKKKLCERSEGKGCPN